MNLEFASNFPHSSNNLKMILLLNTLREHISEVRIDFYRNPSDFYPYLFVFNDQTEAF